MWHKGIENYGAPKVPKVDIFFISCAQDKFICVSSDFMHTAATYRENSGNQV